MMTVRTLARRGGWMLGLLAVLAFGFSAPAAQARTNVSIGVGVGVGGPGYYHHGGPAYHGGYYYGRPGWGPRPYWYGASWYHPYYYWGPSFNFYAAFPLGYVDSWPEPVRVYHRDAYSAALSGPVGEAYAWNDGYDYGSVTATRDGYSGQKYCREFRQDVVIGGKREQAVGAACREADGTWRVVPDNP